MTGCLNSAMLQRRTWMCSIKSSQVKSSQVKSSQATAKDLDLLHVTPYVCMHVCVHVCMLQRRTWICSAWVIGSRVSSCTRRESERRVLVCEGVRLCCVEVRNSSARWPPLASSSFIATPDACM